MVPRLTGRSVARLVEHFLPHLNSGRVDLRRKAAREGIMNSTFISTTDTDQDDTDENRRLMAELSIAPAGRYYAYAGYRYERLADAVAYAQLIRARQSERT